jgi:hypothetical protein
VAGRRGDYLVCHFCQCSDLQAYFIFLKRVVHAIIDASRYCSPVTANRKSIVEIRIVRQRLPLCVTSLQRKPRRNQTRLGFCFSIHQRRERISCTTCATPRNTSEHPPPQHFLYSSGIPSVAIVLGYVVLGHIIKRLRAAALLRVVPASNISRQAISLRGAPRPRFINMSWRCVLQYVLQHHP